MEQGNKYRYAVGIDTGVHTGIAVWDCMEHRFTMIETMQIHQALEHVRTLSEYGGGCKVYIEDPRKRKWYGHYDKKAGRWVETTNANAQQGVGSVKRDAKIWEDMCTDKGIPFALLKPMQNGTKLSDDYFKKITGWKGRTSEHSRDAAMIVFHRDN